MCRNRRISDYFHLMLVNSGGANGWGWFDASRGEVPEVGINGFPQEHAPLS
jgi:hypothetical protein